MSVPVTYSALLVVLAALNASGLGWLSRKAVAAGAKLALFPLLAFSAVTMHVGLMGVGRLVSPGDLLRDLYALPILFAVASVPLTLFAFATRCRRLGFRWAAIDWGHGAVCIGAVVLLFWTLPDLLKLKSLVPACQEDVIWYVPVAEHEACVPQLQVFGDWRLDAVVAIVLGAWGGLGIALAWRNRSPWLAAGTVGGGLLMLFGTGPVSQAFGESLAFAAVAASVVLPGTNVAVPKVS